MLKSKEREEATSEDSGSEEETENGKKNKKKVMRSKPPKKKARMAPQPAAKTVSPDSSEESMFQIGKLCYVQGSLFKVQVLVDLREFYIDKAGDMKPGRKRISLSSEQWISLKERIPEIDAAIKKF